MADTTSESQGLPMPIDMRSDTVTRPTPAMREVIARAEVGDDMWGEDPTVNELERRVAEMLGKEAAVFASSGTQSNQLGVWAHCRAGDELLIHEYGHIANYEGGAPAVLHGVSCRMISGAGGMFDVSDLEAVLHPIDQHFSQTRLVCFENTTNKGGGRVWKREHLQRVANKAHELGLKTHLDGARLFNACVAGRYTPAEICAEMDTVSLCFSKGLGCPMGSMLVGEADEIAQARRGRKIFGGALRQAGMMAASALYALEHHLERLADDHENARRFAERISEIPGIKIDPASVESNLVFFELDRSTGTGDQLIGALAQRDVLMLALGPQRIRACTHLDVTREQVEQAADAITEALERGLDQTDAAAAPHPYAYR
jgi:threonine aldolase